MLSYNAIAQLLGGLGLFLLGMWLLTEGLKLAGGNALQRILANWTVTRWRSFISGFTLTAVVQSSSAVTVSVIGFINAGLLDLSRSLWIVFGSNVGTTMTAWIVALIGFKFKIDALALPAIGIGAMLHLFSNNLRSKSLGGALAGLGLLFLGLQALQGAFANLEQLVDIQALFTGGFTGMLIMVLIGLLLTAVMQSSSAAMAIVLTAVSTEVLPLAAGAAAVIGANVGTTVTALLAVLKATSNARRVAVAHVIFNLITAMVAFLLLGFFLWLVEWLQGALRMEPNAAVSLALFHTVFNLLGVALMIPLEPRITTWLATLFTRGEAQTVKPRFLDRNITSIPDLARNAILLEQLRVLAKLRKLLAQALSGEELVAQRETELRQLVSAINEYILMCSQQSLPVDTASALQDMIQINLRLLNCLDGLQDIVALNQSIQPLAESHKVAISKLKAVVVAAIESCYVESAASDVKGVDRSETGLDEAPADGFEEAPLAELEKTSLAEFEKTFSDVRRVIVAAARNGELTAQTMESLLRLMAVLRRVVRQYGKACVTVAGYSVPDEAEGRESEEREPSEGHDKNSSGREAVARSTGDK